MLTRTRLLTAVTPLYLRDAAAALAMSKAVDLPRLCEDILAAHPEHAKISAAELANRFHMDFHVQCGFDVGFSEDSMRRSFVKLLQDLAEAFATISLFLTSAAPHKFVVMNTWSSRRFLYYFWASDIKKVSLALNDKLFSKLPLPELPVAFLQPCEGDSYLDVLSEESNRIFTSIFRTFVNWRGPRPRFLYMSDDEDDVQDADYKPSEAVEDEVEDERKPSHGQPRRSKAGSLRGRGRPSLLCKEESFDLLNAQIKMEHGEYMWSTGCFTMDMLKSSIENITPMLLGLGEDVKKINGLNVVKFGHLVVTRVFKLSEFSHELKMALREFRSKTELSEIMLSLPQQLKQELKERCPYYLRFAIPNLLTRIKNLACMRRCDDSDSDC